MELFPYVVPAGQFPVSPVIGPDPVVNVGVGVGQAASLLPAHLQLRRHRVQPADGPFIADMHPARNGRNGGQPP
ncbi:hypothetical protein GCM10009565_53090 [Amycolatopsis albidoflavus]